MATFSYAWGNSEGELLQLSELDFSAILFWVLFISLPRLFFGQLDLRVLLCAPLPQPHVACFPLSLSASQTWNGTDDAEIITLSANSPWATQPSPKLHLWLPSFPAKPAAQQLCHPSHYTPLTYLSATGMLFGCPFLDLTTAYLLPVVEALVQTHHHHFPFSCFHRNSY